MTPMTALSWRFTVCLAACALTLAAAGTASAEQLVLQGSSTFNREIIEPFQAAIEAGSRHRLTVIPNRTILGVTALIEGRAQMAMISAPLQSEVDALRRVRPDEPYERLQSHVVRSTRIAIGVNQLNPVRAISIDQARRMLSGEITNWSALGGNDEPIRIVVVGNGGGVTSTVEAVLLGGNRISGPNVLQVKTATQVAQVIEQEPNVMGFGQLLLLKQRGIPELVTERPIEQQLALVTFGNPTPAMQAVIDAARRAAGKPM